MERLEGSVRGELGRFGPPEGDMVAIVRAWPGAVGDENARRAWPARLTREGTLVVHATDSVWAFQLGMLAGEILDQLRAELGAATPSALRFVPGPIPAPAAVPAAERPPRTPAIAPADVAAGAELAAAIEDEELRAIVARAAAASLSKGRADTRSGRGF
jgi:hypothetical protein